LSAIIRLIKIEIAPGTKGAAEDGSATVFLEITTEGQAEILLSFTVREFRSLDQAAEEARKQLLAFAQDLAVAAVARPVRLRWAMAAEAVEVGEARLLREA